MGLFSSKSSKPSQSSKIQNPPPYSATQSQYAPPSDSRPLPSGWITQLDPSTNRWFYVYTPTAHRQWEHPVDSPLSSADRASPLPSQQQQPYYSQQQPYYAQQQQQPYYPQSQQQGRMGGLLGNSGTGRMGGMGGMGMGSTMMMAGGAGLLGYAVGDALFDHDDTVVNNYYGDDYGGGDMGGGGFDGGGFDF